MNICFHHNDADGRMSAAIVKTIHNDCEIVEMAYGFDEEQFKKDYCQTKYENVFVVDFSFTEELMNEIRSRSENFCWIDHHASAKEKLTAWWDNKHVDGVRSLNKSACLLTWEWFYPKKGVSYSVQMINDFDLWLHEDKNSMPFAESIVHEKVDFFFNLLNLHKIDARAD